jgi:hypothetical protein
MRFVLLLALLVSGCASVPVSPPPVHQFISISWAAGFERKQWTRLIRSRWPDRDIVAVFCHGDRNPWLLIPDKPRESMLVTDAVQILRSAFPRYLIVIVACNPRHVTLNQPGVAYPTRYVFLFPGSNARTDSDGELVEGAGDINEFVQTPD